MTANQNPEQKARDHIDALLSQAGWSVQHNKKIDLNAGLGQAVGVMKKWIPSSRIRWLIH